jgi:predicted AAA+ superfamily ATPase
VIHRTALKKINYFASKYPVITLTGPRQSGKSTLLKSAFPTYKYVSLEDPDVRLIAQSDPRGFLKTYNSKTIIDEVQNVPELFSYIQTIVDKENESGMYILSGSQNFLLMEAISQSLAGRTALLKLLPLTINEILSVKPNFTLDEFLFTGSYPRIYDKDIQANEFYPFYIQTFVERDVRLLRNITDLNLYIKFLKLCAARVGQLLNVNSLANECGISVLTVNAWLSVLETSYIIYLLKPFHKNLNKRVVKSPKLFFYDTGLLTSLLNIDSVSQLEFHYLHGNIFENWVINEINKKHYEQGIEPKISFWRDSNGNEIDIILEKGNKTLAFEIKSSSTIKIDHFKGLKLWQKLTSCSTDELFVIYAGDVNFMTSNGKFISWKEMDKIV